MFLDHAGPSIEAFCPYIYVPDKGVLLTHRSPETAKCWNLIVEMAETDYMLLTAMGQGWWKFFIIDRAYFIINCDVFTKKIKDCTGARGLRSFECFPKLCARCHRNPPTISQLFPWYIHYQHNYSTENYSPNCWHDGWHDIKGKEH